MLLDLRNLYKQKINYFEGEHLHIQYKIYQ